MVLPARKGMHMQPEEVADIAEPVRFQHGMIIKKQWCPKAGERVQAAIGDAHGTCILRKTQQIKAVLISVSGRQRRRLPDQQLTGGGRLKGPHQILEEFGSVWGQKIQQVLQAQWDVRALVWTVEADKQAGARRVPVQFHLPKCDAGQLAAHARAGNDHWARVSSVFSKVTEDVREQGRIVEQVCRSIPKVHQHRRESTLDEGVEQDRGVGHHGVCFRVASKKLSPTKIPVSMWWHATGQSEIDALDKHKGAKGLKTSVVDIHVGGHQVAIDPEVMLKRLCRCGQPGWRQRGRRWTDLTAHGLRSFEQEDNQQKAECGPAFSTMGAKPGLGGE